MLGLPETKFMSEAGAVLLRTESERILQRRRVVPARLLEHGFSFQFAHWPAARRLFGGLLQPPGYVRLGEIAGERGERVHRPSERDLAAHVRLLTERLERLELERG